MTDVVKDTKDRAAQADNVTRAADRKVSAEETLKQIEEITKKSVARPRGPAAQEGNDNHPVPPEERTTANAPAAVAQLDSAAGAIAAARTAVTAQLDSDKRLTSDPRYERDQKIFEMGKQGKLGLVPPSDAEKAAMAVRSGLDPAIIDKVPSTPHEQVAQDMPRLQQAEEKSKELAPTVAPGEQETEPQNNFTKMKDEGKNTGDRVPKDEEARKFDTGSDNPDVIK